MTNELVNVSDRQLVLLEAIRKDVEQVHSIEEAHAYADVTKEMADLVSKQRYSFDAVFDLMEKHLRWKRRFGQLLSQTPLSKGGRPSKTDCNLQSVFSLSDLGVEPTDSHRSQKMAAIPDEVFDGHFASMRFEKKELSTAGVLRLLKKPDKEPPPFHLNEEANEIYRWMCERRDKWPEIHREQFIDIVRTQLRRMEVRDDVDRRQGESSSEADPCPFDESGSEVA